MTDPLGRVTTYAYDINGIDLLTVYQKNPAGASLDPEGQAADKLGAYTYNSQHEPLTATDASGKTAVYTYYPNGQVHTVTNAKGEITTYAYDASGYLLGITGPVAGAITSFAYDGFGRLRTTTDSEGYAVTIDYDAIGGDPTKTMDRIAKVTYPDGTYEETTYDRLDPEWTRDRLGRWSRKFYDALRRVVVTQDPLYRITIYDWCNCGSLDGITDPIRTPRAGCATFRAELPTRFIPTRPRCIIPTRARPAGSNRLWTRKAKRQTTRTSSTIISSRSVIQTRKLPRRQSAIPMTPVTIGSPA
jgi:YD repeat-containing protein